MCILAENLSFSYGDLKVLDGLNLCVEAGEHVGIIGESGGGKSTLLKLLSGLHEVEEGRLSVAGETKSDKIMKKVAMVMQTPMLFPATIRENISCGHEMSDAELIEACGIAQLDDWISGLPDGIDTYVGERGSKVSGGQAQRIAIARAVAKKASVILLDEATSALDSDTGNAVMRALDCLTEGKTVVHVTHRPELLSGNDRILMLREGRLQ